MLLRNKCICGKTIKKTYEIVNTTFMSQDTYMQKWQKIYFGGSLQILPDLHSGYILIYLLFFMPESVVSIEDFIVKNYIYLKISIISLNNSLFSL